MSKSILFSKRRIKKRVKSSLLCALLISIGVTATFTGITKQDYVCAQSNNTISSNDEGDQTSITEETSETTTTTFQIYDLFQSYIELQDETQENENSGAEEDPGIDGTYDIGYNPEDYIIKPDFLWTSLAVSTNGYSILPNKGAYKDYTYTNFVEKFTAPINGIYKLEVWGAQGGGERSTDGGLGGYSSGYYRMNKDQSIYICVGAAGLDENGGYNGGATGLHGPWQGGWRNTGAGGGGCTSITTSNRGTLASFDQHRNEVLLVGGGGGGNHHAEASSYGGHEKRDSKGTGAGGLSTDGIIASMTKTKDNRSPLTRTIDVRPVGQTYGYKFGQGQSSGNDYGGGGGGWYGGYSVNLSDYVFSGGGGSSYLGGLPAFSIGGMQYLPETKSAINYGNGKAKITLTEASLSVSIDQTSIEKIEKQQATISGFFEGTSTYAWEVQKAEIKSSLKESNWSEINFKDTSHIRKTDTIANQSGTSSIQITAQPTDHNTWYRLKISNNSQIKYSNPCQLKVVPLKIDHLLCGERPIIEVGDDFHVDSVPIIAVYNNNEVTKNIWEDNTLQSQMYFIQNEESYKSVSCNNIGTQEIEISLIHEDKPQSLKLSYLVNDTMPPIIQNISILNHKYLSQNEETSFTFQVDAMDKSITDLQYYITDKNGKILTPKQKNSNISASFQQNEVIIVYVCDSSGNYSSKEYKVVFVDEAAPIINISVDVTEWTQNPVMIHVDAKDDLSGLADEPYSFDGGKSWQKETSYEVIQNGKINIQVKDQVGNIIQKEVNIQNIDSSAPIVQSITCDPEKNWSEGIATVTISANDPGSGLADEPYSFDGGKTWQSKPFINLNQSSILPIRIRDNIGNILQKEYEIVKITKVQEIVNKITKHEINVIQDVDDKKSVTVSGNNMNQLFERKQIHTNENAGKKIFLQVEEKVEEEFTDPVILKKATLKDQSLSGTMKQDTLNLESDRKHSIYKFPIAKNVATAAATSSTIGLSWFGFLFLYFRKCHFYYASENVGEEEYYKSKILHRKKNKYVVRFHHESALMSGESYRICFSKRFYKKNNGKTLTISFSDIEYDTKIQEVTLVHMS